MCGYQGLEYQLNQDLKTYSVSGIGECSDADIIIPRDFNGLHVTEIGNQAFRGTNIASVKIHDGISAIKILAFAYCKNLKRVEMQNGIKES